MISCGSATVIGNGQTWASAYTVVVHYTFDDTVSFRALRDIGISGQDKDESIDMDNRHAHCTGHKVRDHT